MGVLGACMCIEGACTYISVQESVHLERYLKTWLDGDLSDLLFERRTLQKRLQKPNQGDYQKHLA